MTAYLPHLGRHAGAGRMYQLLVRMAARYRITLLSFLEHEEEQQFLPELEAAVRKGGRAAAHGRRRAGSFSL